MNDFARFATRYHKLKADIQEMEEIEYARLDQREADVRHAWLGINDTKRTSQIVQGSVTSVRDWSEFEQYHRRLEVEQFALEHQWNEAKVQRDAQQVKLHAAFVEKEKWSKVSQDAWTQWQMEQSRKSQVEADDAAVQRFRKVDPSWQRD